MGTIATAIIVGSAIAGAGAVAASGINAASQHSTNKRQEEMFHDQMAYQTSEREATQAYNNPVNQRKRLEAAGINPYFAMSGIDAGNTTAQTAPSAPQLQAPQYGNILQALSDSLGNGLQNYNQFEQNEQLQLGIEQQRVDTRYKLTEKLLQLNEQRLRIVGMNIDNKYKDQQLDFINKQMTRLQQDIDFTNETWNDQKATITANRKRAEIDADLAELDKDYKTWFNDYQKQYGAESLKALQASINETLSRIDLNKATSAKTIADKCVSEATAKGIKIDNAQKNKINWMLRQDLKLTIQGKKYGLDRPSYFEREIYAPFARGMNQVTGLDKRTTLGN